MFMSINKSEIKSFRKLAGYGDHQVQDTSCFGYMLKNEFEFGVPSSISLLLKTDLKTLPTVKFLE